MISVISVVFLILFYELQIKPQSNYRKRKRRID